MRTFDSFIMDAVALADQYPSTDVWISPDRDKPWRVLVAACDSDGNFESGAGTLIEIECASEAEAKDVLAQVERAIGTKVTVTRCEGRGKARTKKGRGKAKKTLAIIETSVQILEESKFPLTIRRLYYELISKGVIENSTKSYASMVTKLTNARWDGDIPITLLGKIIDGGREPHSVSSWTSLADYARTAAAIYKRDRWENQAAYCELWVEKQAVVSLLTGVCRENQIILRPLHGFNSFTAIHQAAKDLLEIHKNINIFYLGDHDPHGHEIERDAKDRLFKMFDLLGSPAKRHQVEFHPRLGILPEDIGKYGILPLDVEAAEKGGDNFKIKRDEFIAKYGNAAAEVDGLPAEVLIERVQDAIDDEGIIDDRDAWDDGPVLTEADREEIRIRLEAA